MDDQALRTRGSRLRVPDTGVVSELDCHAGVLDRSRRVRRQTPLSQPGLLAPSVEPIGSGGSYAVAAARALLKHTNLTAAEMVRTALEIAADLCIYTNRNIEVEQL